jgi:hypothetical protein
VSDQDPQHVVTGKVRLSFVHAFTPHASVSGGEAKYSVTLLIPKSDMATMQRISAAIEVATQAGVSSKWDGVRPPRVAHPLYDGDGVRPSDGMPFGDECKGCWVITASDTRPPEIIDLGLNPILSQSEVYSGMYGRVSMRFFAYANKGKKGVGAGLRNIQKLGDGEPLGGGRSSAADDFGGAPGAYPQQPPAQPGYAPQGYAQAPVQPGYPAPGQPMMQPPAQQSYVQAPVQPAYPPQQPGYSPQGQSGYPAQPSMQQPTQQPPQFDPITGRPVTGGVMGLY